jgi:flagellar assembly factor FliW
MKERGIAEMILQSKYFGRIEFAEEKIITFEHGIIAFEGMKRFFIIDNEDENNPLWWLQSVDDPEILFVVINPFTFKPDYDFELLPQDAEELQIEKPEDVVVLAIVVVPEDIKQMTANLLAPVIINIRQRKGKQVVLQDKRYFTKHLIIEELAKTQKARQTQQKTSARQMAKNRTGARKSSGEEECCHARTNQKKR